MVEVELEEGELLQAGRLGSQQEGLYLYSAEEDEEGKENQGKEKRLRIQEEVTGEEEEIYARLDPGQEGLSEAAYDRWS